MASTVCRIPRADEIAEAVVDVAESRSIDELGFMCFRMLEPLTGSQAMGLYLVDGNVPRLTFSREAPVGLLDEYELGFYERDPLLGYISSNQRPVDGLTALGKRAWLECGTLDFLKRWGFDYCMAGPLCVDNKILGLIYTSMRRPGRSYNSDEMMRMSLLCRAGSIALDRIVHASSSFVMDGPLQESRRYREPWEKHQLPARALEVARLLCAGQTNKEIARKLGISPYTVKDHVSALCAKFGAHNRTQLVKIIMSVA